VNVQDQEVGVNDDMSVKFTPLPAQTIVWLAAKSATGANDPGL